MILSDHQAEMLTALIGPCDIAGLVDAVRACGFNEADYLTLNPDLSPAGVTINDALFHFLAYGSSERRLAPTGHILQGIGTLLRSNAASTEYLQILCRSLFEAQIKKPQNRAEIVAGIDPELIAAIRSLGGRPVFLLGDSHSTLYVQAAFDDSGWLAPLQIFCGGGSAKGLANNASRSQYGTMLLHWARTTTSLAPDLDVPVFLKFGQVDVEFVWTFTRVRNDKKNFSFAEYESFARASVCAYDRFVETFCSIVDPSLVRVCSIFPPVLSDETWAQGYVSPDVTRLEADRDIEALSQAIRNMEIPDLATRTCMHALYNVMLKRLCDSRGLVYIDDFLPFLGGNGIADPQFFPVYAGRDHHLEHVSAAAPIVEIMRRHTESRSQLIRRNGLPPMGSLERDARD